MVTEPDLAGWGAPSPDLAPPILFHVHRDAWGHTRVCLVPCKPPAFLLLFPSPLLRGQVQRQPCTCPPAGRGPTAQDRATVGIGGLQIAPSLRCVPIWHQKNPDCLRTYYVPDSELDLSSVLSYLVPLTSSLE